MAQRMSHRSPVLMEVPCDIHSRYMPAMAIRAESQVFFSIFFPKTSEMKGTMTMYVDVMKPPFPAPL